MSAAPTRSPAKAAAILLMATVFWATSFIFMKTLGQCQQRLVPSAGTWYISALSLLVRFGVSSLVLAVWQARRWRTFTRLELWHGVGLGVFCALGIVFQMDGVMHTAASTSAFLTQCYCIFIPVVVALHKRKWPTSILAVCCILVMAGVAILGNINWRELRLGRGEAESILASFIFTAQILWLERPIFARNNTDSVTLIMFVVVTLVILPVVLATGHGPREWVLVYSTPATLGIIALLTIACTLATYGLMNKWQAHISASHASLIYCTESLFTSVFALFLPGWLSKLAHVDYPNEHITWRLVVGGGLILAANLVILWEAKRLEKKVGVEVTRL